MYLVAIGWIYVVLMMSVAEAQSPQGTVVGAFFTFLLYGVLPLSIVLYIMGTPGRKKALRAAEAAEAAAAQPAAIPAAMAAAAPEATPASAQPDGGSHAAGEAVAPERKEG